MTIKQSSFYWFIYRTTGEEVFAGLGSGGLTLLPVQLLYVTSHSAYEPIPYVRPIMRVYLFCHLSMVPT